jgi:hypothetical protein
MKKLGCTWNSCILIHLLLIPIVFIQNITHYIHIYVILPYLKFKSDILSLFFISKFRKVYILVSFNFRIKTHTKLSTHMVSKVISLIWKWFINVMCRSSYRQTFSRYLISEAMFISCSEIEITSLPNYEWVKLPLITIHFKTFLFILIIIFRVVQGEPENLTVF